MENWMWYWLVMLFFSGLMVFMVKRKHLLMVLLSLEYMMLFIYIMLFMFLSGVDSDMFMMVVFLVFAVGEGVLGLSIMVSMIRTHGNDYFQSFVVLRC